ncbi:MAG: helix-turn-helix domain-containing protein [Firmicutes bacterium]|nr:helix-turn-helix domain-containing protein [Bacillota bacterium]
MRPVAKTLYFVAQALQPRSISELARHAGVDRSTASEACAELARAGWMKIVKSRREHAPVAVIPGALQAERAESLRKILAMVRHKGEFLMKCWLDLMVPSDDYLDNARPEFLLNPVSGEPLEFDRYYLLGVAFEFNGPQHYGPTVVYPDERAFREVRTRDLLKRGLSQEKGIVLVTITAQDLSLEEMRRKIPDRLPRGFVDTGSPYVRTLERASAEYREKASG